MLFTPLAEQLCFQWSNISTYIIQTVVDILLDLIPTKKCAYMMTNAELKLLLKIKIKMLKK